MPFSEVFKLFARHKVSAIIPEMAEDEKKTSFGGDVPDERKMLLMRKNCVFFFDIDGTLADIAPTPDAALIPQETLDNLVFLADRSAVALVSGRSIASIDALTDPLKFPAAGQHGLEIRFSTGEIIPLASHQSIMASVNKQVADFMRDHPELVVEYKGLSVAIHYRLVPELAGAVHRFARSCVAPHEDILCIQQGKMVEEIKLRGGSKGTAVKAFMERPAFCGKIPVFAGDDKTDEDAFEVVNRLGGISIQIGSSSRKAHFSLPSPRNLRLWINEIVTNWTNTP